MSDIMTIDNFVADHSENIGKDRREIKKALHIKQDSIGVSVYAVAINKNSDNNRLLEIPTTSGSPLNYEVHNIVRDCYHVAGVSFHEIGEIPVNYCITMDETSWEEDIPLPPSVINRYMTEKQRELFEAWRATFNSDDHSILYLQILGTF